MKKEKFDWYIRIDINSKGRNVIKIRELFLWNVTEDGMLSRALHFYKWHVARLKSHQSIFLRPIMREPRKGEVRNLGDQWRIRLKFTLSRRLLRQTKNPAEVFVKGYGPEVAAELDR